MIKMSSSITISAFWNEMFLLQSTEIYRNTGILMHMPAINKLSKAIGRRKSNRSVAGIHQAGALGLVK